MRRLATGLSAAALLALGAVLAPSGAAAEEGPPEPDAPRYNAAVHTQSAPDDPAPPDAAATSSGADLGYEADDPAWVEWVAQFEGLEWDEVDWSAVEPLPPAEPEGDVSTADDTDHIGWGTCGWWWKLDWDPTSVYNPDEDLEVTYGLGATCNFPDVIFPAWDSRAQASLHDDGNSELDQAPVGAGAWDCPDCDGLSSGTVALDWPDSYRLEGWSQIFLYPGCDPSGCGDPGAWWFWGEVPDGCRGTATPLLECEFSTDLWHIGEPVCGGSWNGGDGRASVQLGTSCTTGPRIDVAGTVRLAGGNDGYCAYVWVWFANGVSEWAGTCDPSSPETFSWSHLGRVVAVTAWAEPVAPA